MLAVVPKSLALYLPVFLAATLIVVAQPPTQQTPPDKPTDPPAIVNLDLLNLPLLPIKTSINLL